MLLNYKFQGIFNPYEPAFKMLQTLDKKQTWFRLRYRYGK